MDLNGKTALITGGAMGIGLAIAKRLAEAGANIVLVDINEEAGKAAVHEMRESDSKVKFVHCNVGYEDQVRYAVNEAVHSYGYIDILVNNAGIYPVIPLMHMSEHDFNTIIAVNLKSAFLFTKAVAEVMINAKRGGKVINITSIDAVRPSSIGLAMYDASKHGMWGFTKNVSLELAAHNIQVNAIAPGGINTPGTGAGKEMSTEKLQMHKAFLEMIPMKRMGEADEIGKVALFLASDLSSYMTGSQVVVDGGVLLV